MKRCIVLVATLLTGFDAMAQNYVEQWGPNIGKALPVLEAPDQSGKLQTLDSLTGRAGLLLFLNRSTDW